MMLPHVRMQRRAEREARRVERASVYRVKIRELLAANGWTHRELAKRCKVETGTLRAWLHAGNCPGRNSRKIIDKLLERK